MLWHDIHYSSYLNTLSIKYVIRRTFQLEFCKHQSLKKSKNIGYVKMDHFQFAKSHYDGPSPWYIASLRSWSLPQLQSYPWFAWLEETWDLPRTLGTNRSKWIQQMKFDGWISSMLHPPKIRWLALPLEWPKVVSLGWLLLQHPHSIIYVPSPNHI